MIHSVRFAAILDTNVIYPITIRDLLLWFAHHDLFTPKWSQHIFDEWADVMRRKGVKEATIAIRLKWPNQAFPDALVANYEPLIKTVNLPDKKDCHVLAAAIKTNANVIVTNNLKDFPQEYLTRFSLSAKNADDFATDIIDLNPQKAVEAFKEMVLNRTNPDQDEYQILDYMRNNYLEKTANYIHSLI